MRPLRYSKKFTVCFALFEKIDRWVIDDLADILEKSGLFNISSFNGINYDSYVTHNKQNINEKNYPAPLSRNKIILAHGKTSAERMFTFLINEKVHSLETRVLFKRIILEKNRISKACRENTCFIIPEDMVAARGRLVATIAKAYKRKVLVFLPLYHDWITTYPLCAKRIADFWILYGNNYRSRLLWANINPKTIFTTRINLSEKNKRSKNLRQKAATNVLGKPYYLVTLQDNEELELTVSFVADAVKYISDKTIIFKYHPSTSAKIKKYLKSRYLKDNICFLDDISLNSAIKQSLGLITVSSTTALDALYCDKPVIIINTGYFFHELSLLARRANAFKIIRDPKRLADLINSLDKKQFRAKYIKQQAILKKEYLSNNKKTLASKSIKSLISKCFYEK